MDLQLRGREDGEHDDVRKWTGSVMAFIREFAGRPLTPKRIHGPVVCGYQTVELDGRTVLQLETYGSRDRVVRDAPSQKIQVDREGAATLKRILEQSFPGI